MKWITLVSFLLIYTQYQYNNIFLQISWL
jgi:hypothetical protein